MSLVILCLLALIVSFPVGAYFAGRD